jgi:hypothetical protein
MNALRRSPWLSAGVVLTIAAAGTLAIALGASAGSLLAGLLGGFALALWVRVLRRGTGRPPRAPRAKGTALSGGRPYDLGRDQSTDSQRWLM